MATLRGSELFSRASGHLGVYCDMEVWDGNGTRVANAPVRLVRNGTQFTSQPGRPLIVPRSGGMIRFFFSLVGVIEIGRDMCAINSRPRAAFTFSARTARAPLEIRPRGGMTRPRMTTTGAFVAEVATPTVEGSTGRVAEARAGFDITLTYDESTQDETSEGSSEEYGSEHTLGGEASAEPLGIGIGGSGSSSRSSSIGQSRGSSRTRRGGMVQTAEILVEVIQSFRMEEPPPAARGRDRGNRGDRGAGAECR